MNTQDLRAKISALRTRAERLRPPQHRKPEAFHEDKSDLVQAIDDLDEFVRTGGEKSASADVRGGAKKAAPAKSR